MTSCVVAFLIYEFLSQIRGTRAALILVGATVTGLVFYFSRVFGLTTLNWLIARFFPYAAFIVIVIFAPEIREAFARLGRRLTLASSSRGGSGSRRLRRYRDGRESVFAEPDRRTDRD